MGSALLLGSGLAYSQPTANQTELMLDSRAAADRPVQLYALETMSGGFVPTGTTTRYYGLDSIGDETTEADNQLWLAVNAKRRIDGVETVFVRLELGGGLVFNESADVSVTVRGADTPDNPDTDADEFARGSIIGSEIDFAARTSGGTAGGSFIVFPVDVGTADIPIGSHISVNVTDDLAAPRSAGGYTAAISAHSDPDDAIDGIGARNTIFGGSATIVSLTNGLRVDVAKGDNVTAEVNAGFLWFQDSPLTAQERLGWVDVKPAAPGGATVHNAADGEAIADSDLIGENGIEIIVSGELGIGAFSILEGDMATAAGERTAGMEASCPEGMADAPDQGNLMMRDEDADLLIDEEGVNSGATEGTSGPLPILTGMEVYTLCVNVDVMGPESNSSPIPATEFTGTVMITPAGAAVRASDAYMAAEGVIGKIVRNGASVEIPYLTTSEKHNQRLIVVNRGTRPAAITDITFTTEDGTEVELMDTVQAAMDAGLLAVPAKSSWVARMDKTINITGDSRRVAASVAFAATVGNISVATTQINVSDGSTDTVVYEVK